MLVTSLPDMNKIVLEKLTAHLARVASFADTNLMTIANLGFLDVDDDENDDDDDLNNDE